MKKVLITICLILSITTNIWAIEAENIKVKVLSKTDVSWNKKALPEYPEGKPEITILKIIIPPKVNLPWHTHPVINAGVLLKGQLTVVTEKNKILHLKAGDPIVEVINKWHYGKNEGKIPAEIIVFYAGIQGKPITIKKDRGVK